MPLSPGKTQNDNLSARSNKSFINHPLLKKDTLQKRLYQLTIFATAAKPNINCLVVIPTGLGKTIIALLTSLHRLTEYPESQIVFLAPTRPLVEQHKKTFEALTTIEADQLVLLTGAIAPKKREILYKNAKVIFLTPQILQNDIISRRFSLENVSLLIFDEAHRGVGEYAYTFIAREYMQVARWKKILAITASPGKDREKIREVMDNLYLNMVEIRTETDPDVRPYIHQRDVKWIEIALPDEMKRLLRILKDLESEIYIELYNNDILESPSPEKQSRKSLLLAGKKLDLLINRRENENDLMRLLYLKKLLSNAIRLSHMSELIESQGVRTLKQYLDKNIEEIKYRKASKSLEELFKHPKLQELYHLAEELLEKGIDHPKLTYLKELLIKQFQTNPESRVLVFCQYRDTVSAILKYLKDYPEIKAERFIGQQSRGRQKGITQREQIALLERFKEGEINTLVATSVAEEGLDISECDLVIFYDVIPSEIRSIQRRGRTGRKREGQVIIFKTEGTREESYYWAEKYREQEMKRVLRELQREYKRKLDKMASPNSSSSKDKKERGQKTLSSYFSQKKKDKENSIEKTRIKEEGKKDHELNKSLNDSEKERVKELVNLITPSESHPMIIIDSRETASSVVRRLHQLRANIVLKTLPIGDYIISERCGIERKTIPDLIKSIKDGRLFKELSSLRRYFVYPLLIIEGSLSEITEIKKPALMGLISTLLLKMDIRLLQTKDASETADYLYYLAKKEQEEQKEKTITVRHGKLPEYLPAQLEYIVSGIPGINASRARDLLRELGTVEKIFSASEEELRKVSNIGPVIAKQIRKYATSKYLLDD